LKRKKTIGVQIDSIEGSFADRVWPQLRRYLDQKDYQFILFPGKIIRSPIPLDYQFNRIYNFISPQCLDGLILSYGLDFYTSVDEQENLVKEFGNIPKIAMGAKLKGIPSVITQNREAVYNITEHLYLKNHRKKIAFISGPPGSYEANCRRQGFIDFHRDNHLDSPQDRIVEGGDYLKYTGIAGVLELLERDIPFDALVCSSDTQAVGAYEELQKRGYSIPQDISIVGFDDVRDRDTNKLNLTTVRQPIDQICQKTVNLMDQLMKGESVEPITEIPMDISIRTSCGCFTEEWSRTQWFNETRQIKHSHQSFPTSHLKPLLRIADEADEMLHHIESSLNRLKETDNFEEAAREELVKVQQILLARIGKGFDRDYHFWNPIVTILQDWVLSSDLDRQRIRDINLFFQKVRVLIAEKQRFAESFRTEEFLRHSDIIRILSQRFIFTSDFKQVEFALSETLGHLGIKALHVFLFQGEMNEGRSLYLPLPEYARPVISLYSSKSEKMAKRKIKTKRLMNDAMRNDPYGHYIVLPLFQIDELLGYILIAPGPEIGSFYINLIYLLSSVLKSVLLYQSQQEYQKKLKSTLKELEKSNHKLKAQNRVDPLTSLYNRRGFHLLAENNLQLIRRMNKEGLLFYGDMDGLKKINDTWGHKAGDEAIAGVAWALQHTFRSSDILSRFGGDEFVVLTIDSNEEDLNEIYSRLRDNLKKKSRQGRGFSLKISMGHLLINKENAEKSLEELLHMADKELYKEKQRRKKRAD